MTLALRAGTAADHPVCLAIAAALPAFFNQQGLAAIAHDLGHQALLLAADGATPVGFVLLARTSPQVAEITWMAVRPDRHGQGIGGQLVRAAVTTLEAEGTRLLVVKTLAPTVDYPPYEPTRAFYEALGFLVVADIDPYPPWGDGNPCRIYARPLSPQP